LKRAREPIKIEALHLSSISEVAMIRIVPVFGLFALGMCLLAVDAQEVKKKTSPDTSAFSGKITDVNLDERTKKLDSLYVKGLLGKRIQLRNVRINEKTVFEYVGFKKGVEEAPHIGDAAEGKIDPVSDFAVNVKITAGPGLKAPPTKKKAT